MPLEAVIVRGEVAHSRYKNRLGRNSVKKLFIRMTMHCNMIAVFGERSAMPEYAARVVERLCVDAGLCWLGIVASQ